MIYCRKNAELTVVQMASLLDIEKNEYHQYECHFCEPPLQILLKFARCFNVPMEDFVDDDMDIVVFERKYDHFHFAEFREKREFFEKFIEKNHKAKKLCIDDFIKERKFYSGKKKADIYYT